MTLPRSNRLPICGPLEGLALTYILREQSTLLSGDPRLRSTFETRLSDSCPGKSCYEEFFEHRITRVSKMATGEEEDFNLLLSDRNRGRQGQRRRSGGGGGPQEVSSTSFVQMKYWSEEFIPVRKFRSGSLDLIQRLGGLCGICSVVILVVVLLKKTCSRGRGRMLFAHNGKMKHSSRNV